MFHSEDVKSLLFAQRECSLPKSLLVFTLGEKEERRERGRERGRRERKEGKEEEKERKEGKEVDNSSSGRRRVVE